MTLNEKKSFGKICEGAYKRLRRVAIGGEGHQQIERALKVGEHRNDQAKMKINFALGIEPRYRQRQ
jgi:hypothetical protein